MKPIRGRYLLGWAVFALAGPAARGQTRAWLDFDGAIPGGSTDLRHPRWIEIQAFSFGTGRAVETSSGGGQRAGGPSLSEVTVHKSMDSASARLFLGTVGTADPYPRVTLDLDAGLDSPFARLEMEDVWVTSQQSSASTGDEKGSESIALNFAKITLTYFLPDSKNVYASYDIPAAKADGGTGTWNPDSDKDGMPDAWETTYGLAVGINDAQADDDGDGLTNLHEYQLGTHPRSGTSFFKARLTASADTCDVTWNSVPGKSYLIEWSPDLVTPFTTLRTVTASAAETTANFPRSGSLGFYRVRPK